MRIVSRAEWGAAYGQGPVVKLPWGEVVIHTEAGAVRKQDWPELTKLASVLSLSEAEHMRAIERYHVKVRGWQGIGYSFVIFEDGTICEGRGWGRAGGHTEGRNSTAAGVCFTGHGDLQPATEAQWHAARWLIAEGVERDLLLPNPIITGHRNYSTKGKTCPGNLIYPHIGRLRGITGHEETDMTPEERKMLAEVHAWCKALPSITTTATTAELKKKPVGQRATLERTTTATYEATQVLAEIDKILERAIQRIDPDTPGDVKALVKEAVAEVLREGTG